MLYFKNPSDMHRYIFCTSKILLYCRKWQNKRQKEPQIKLFKYLVTTITVVFAAQQLVAGGHGDGHPILTPLEPKAMDGAYTAMLMGEGAFKANSGFDEKTYQLVALAASAGMKCEYCIVAHTAFAKAAGATDEEIKTVAMMAGIIAINSTMLYANQFDLDALRKMFGQ
jgi:AhpD family alkylhydroperoxidase